MHLGAHAYHILLEAEEIPFLCTHTFGLSAGAIAGISIGCVLFAAAVMIACVLWCRRKKGDSATATISSDGGGAAEENDEVTGSGLSWKPIEKPMKRVNV